MKQLLFLLLLAINLSVSAQELEDLLNDQLKDSSKTELVPATFKSVQLINSHTTKLPDKGDLILLISHRFGNFSTGFSDLWGLDNATMRFGFEYGVSPSLSLGFGRSTYRSSYDLFAKQLLFVQQTGKKEIPLSLGVLAVSNISSDKWPDDGRDYLFAHRMSYTLQLLLSRKFNRNLSLQLMPTFIHRNLVETATDQNDVFAIGAGGRMKLNNWVALTGEYHFTMPGETAHKYENPLSLGVDLETGGHVFQLFFTNSTAIYDEALITQTTGKWLAGDIRFGFNISRTF